MADKMTFPATFKEFAEQYKIVDKEEVYTNGVELIPIFRVEQWLDNANADVAREIFNDIENALFSSYYSDEIEDSMLTFTLKELDEVKHKHLNEDFFVKMTGFVEPIIPRTIESIADLAFPESEGEG